MTQGPTVLFLSLRSSARATGACLAAANSLGYRTVVLGGVGDLPAFAADATEVVRCDPYDRDDAVRAARTVSNRANVRGVVSWGEDHVEAAADIAADLDLRGPSPRAAGLVRDKAAMRKTLGTVPSLAVRAVEISNEVDLDVAIDTIGFPAVLKPTRSAGSYGVYEVLDARAARTAFEVLLAGTRRERHGVFRAGTSPIIYEEFLPGSEHSVEAIVQDRTVHVYGMTDKITSDGRHLERQHALPSRLGAEVRTEVHTMTDAVVRVLGLNDCALHLEVKIGPNGPRLIEVAARSGGDYITSHLIPMATGRNFLEEVIRVAVGDPIEGPLDPIGVVGIEKVFADDAAYLARTTPGDGLAELEALWVEPVSLVTGDEAGGPAHVASVLARGRDRAELERRLRVGRPAAAALAMRGSSGRA